jgi:hypothetical protein
MFFLIKAGIAKGDKEMCCQAHRQRILLQNKSQAIIYGAQHQMLGYVSENGFLYDCCQNLLGYVSEQGIVRNLTLQKVGQVNMTERSFPMQAGHMAFFLLTFHEEEV